MLQIIVEWHFEMFLFFDVTLATKLQRWILPLLQTTKQRNKFHACRFWPSPTRYKTTSNIIWKNVIISIIIRLNSACFHENRLTNADTNKSKLSRYNPTKRNQKHKRKRITSRFSPPYNKLYKQNLVNTFYS